MAADGTLAASQRGGLLVVCDLPRSVTDSLFGFSPQRVQILLGFAYTSTEARANVGGFNLGDLTTAIPGGGGGSVLGGFDGGGLSGPLSPNDIDLPGDDLAAPTSPAPTTGPENVAEVGAPVASLIPDHLSTGTKWLLALLGIVFWMGITHVGAKQFLLATSGRP